MRLLPAVLACTFAGAGQAQTIYSGGLDHAVGELVRTLVNEAELSDKRVLVKSEDFFELGTELRPKPPSLTGGGSWCCGSKRECVTGTNAKCSFSP